MITINEKLDYIKDGKKIVDDNPFYHTLNLLIKYYFVQQKDFYLMTFIEDVTSSENEFKVFMIFKEFAIYCKIDEISAEFIQKNNFNSLEGIVRLSEIKKFNGQ